MTVILKRKTEITVPSSIRRQAGIKAGDKIKFSVSLAVITISLKLSPDEVPDEREIRNPKTRAAIQASHVEFVAGKRRRAEAFFARRVTRAKKRNS